MDLSHGLLSIDLILTSVVGDFENLMASEPYDLESQANEIDMDISCPSKAYLNSISPILGDFRD